MEGKLPNILQFFPFCTRGTRLSFLVEDKSVLFSDSVEFFFTYLGHRNQKHQAALQQETTCSCSMKNGYVINVRCTQKKPSTKPDF